MTFIKVKTNKNNIKYALVQNGDNYAVYKLCENYCSHVKGGIAKTWRYVENKMTLENADLLFARRAK